MTPISSDQTQALVQREPDLGVTAPVFTPIDFFTTFTAEYAVIGDDLVFHFFAPTPPRPDEYWVEVFPAVLDKTAQEYFQVSYPRLKAAYTEEMSSWWMRAYGFGNSLNYDGLVYRFFETLDVNLDATTIK